MRITEVAAATVDDDDAAAAAADDEFGRLRFGAGTGSAGWRICG